MAEQTVIIDVSLNAADATQRAQELGNRIKSIREEQKQLKASNEETGASFQQNALTIRQAVAEQKAYIQISTAAEGSNNQLRAQLALLTQQYNSLGSAERDNTTAGKSLQIQIRGISDELKKNESAVGDNRRNVGNYKDALTQSNDAINQQKQSLSALNPVTQQAGISFQLAGQQIKSFTDQLTAFKQASQEAKAAQSAFKEAQTIATQATEAANVATEAATAIGFRFSQGEATQTAVLAANTAATDAQIIATEAQAAATAASVTATNASTNAMKIFKVALASTGIGAIVIILAAVISYLSKFDPIIDKIEQAFAGFGAAVEVVVQRIVGFFQNITSLGDALGKLGNFLANPIAGIKELGSSMRDAALAAAELKKAQQDLEDQVKIQEISNANAIQQIKELTLQARNRSLTEKQRQDLLKQANKIDQDNFKAQQKIAEEKKRIAIQDIANIASVTKEEIAQLKERGIAYAFELKNRVNLTDEQVDALKDAELEIIKNREETTNRQEKNLNLQSALEEKAQAEAEKRAAKNKELQQKAIEADEERLSSLVRVNEQINTERKNEEDSVNREIDEKIKKYQRYGKVTAQLELERTARLKEIAKEYAEEISKSTDEVLAAVQEIYISRIQNQNDRELAEIAFQNERKLALLDENILATEERIKKGETGLTELLLAQTILREETLAQKQIETDAVNEQVRLERQTKLQEDAQKQIERDQSVFDAKVKIQEQERSLQDQGLALLENVFGKESALGKAAFLAQKAFAIARIIIDTQIALAANRTAEQVTNAKLALLPFGQFAAIANSAVQQAARTRLSISAALSVATVAASAVAGFADGVIGFNSDGQGSMVKGKGSATSDSINARLSNGESVINARSTAMFAPILSAINEAGGGRPLAPGFAMAQGGFVSDMTTQIRSEMDIANIVINTIKSMPNPVVSVEQINSQQAIANRVFVEQNL